MALIDRVRGAVAVLRGQQATSIQNSTPAGPRRASGRSGGAYDAAATGRRAFGWQPNRLGPSTNLMNSLEMSRSRCRDAVRNDPWATSACDNFESQVIGNGIAPHWNIKDATLKAKIEDEWKKWAGTTDCVSDQTGNINFYGLQALVAREMFEAGEAFVRFHRRPSTWDIPVKLQLSVLEGEQLPVFKTEIGGTDRNSIRTGIEFNTSNQRVAYHFYREHPGETMFYPMDGLTYVRIPADDILHIYKPYRAGQLRGQPHLSSVLAMLYELEQYTDAAVVKKKIQEMFVGFIEKTSPDADILPPDPENHADAQSDPPTPDPGTRFGKMEPGTFNELLPGEKITFPTLPQDNDIETFLRVMLHKFAVGVGATYYQITGDLTGANYSSIRAGLLDFRRKCEQLQLNIFVQQLCVPVVKRWLKQASLSGVLSLPGYANDPTLYEDITWSLPKWAWVDPLKDMQAEQLAVRSGFTSREHVVSEMGEDVAKVDEQQARDNARSDAGGLRYDSDGRNSLKGETLAGAGAKAPSDEEDAAPPKKKTPKQQ